jgi:single-stranded DNA-binding protein
MPRDTIDGFSFEGQGTLDRIDTFTAKSGKDIVTLVLRVGGQYPQLVPVKIFGRAAEGIGDLRVGNVLRVSGRLGGRDWNGKVYGDSVATQVDVVGQGSAGSGQQHREERAEQGSIPQNKAPEEDSVPF